jgi:hypothetical protein
LNRSSKYRRTWLVREEHGERMHAPLARSCHGHFFYADPSLARHYVGSDESLLDSYPIPARPITHASTSTWWRSFSGARSPRS